MSPYRYVLYALAWRHPKCFLFESTFKCPCCGGTYWGSGPQLEVEPKLIPTTTGGLPHLVWEESRRGCCTDQYGKGCRFEWTIWDDDRGYPALRYETLVGDNGYDPGVGSVRDSQVYPWDVEGVQQPFYLHTTREPRYHILTGGTVWGSGTYEPYLPERVVTEVWREWVHGSEYDAREPLVDPKSV